MTYTWTIGKNSITINTATGTITGSTYPLRDLIKENFPGIAWDKDGKCWTMDGDKMQQIVDEYNAYFVRVYHMETVTAETSTQVETETNKTVTFTALENGKDGFYQVIHYSDGTQKRHFVG